jgi:hypothetical protein
MNINLRGSWKSILRLILAGTLGYALIVVLTTLGFGWVKGDGSFSGDWRLMAQGGAVALVSGLAGGALAGLLGGRRPLRHALAVLPWLLVDSTYVLFFFPRQDPFWFDLLGALGLMSATIAGGALIAAARRRSDGAPVRGPAGEMQAPSGQT